MPAIDDSFEILNVFDDLSKLLEAKISIIDNVGKAMPITCS